MKRIKMFLFSVICLLVIPFSVDAASAKISVSAPSSVVVGNTITVTVTLSSSSKIGSWEMDLNYNSDYLKMTQAGGEGGGTSMVNSSSGITKKTYTFKFKALKSGSTKISVPSYDVYAFDFSEMDVSSVSDTVKIMTQSELEATYSSDSYLKKLTVGNYELSPAFKKDVYEYSVEVENSVTSVKITGTKNDSNSDVSGDGEFNLEEGNNKFEIVVTAQKGNQSTYIVNVYRKELDPIIVYVEDENKSYTMVRKEANLPELSTYSLDSLTYEDNEVPSLVSDITGYELVGLKDDEGNVYLYIIDNGIVTVRYTEITGIPMSLYPQPLETNDNFKDYKKYTEVINEKEIEGYKLTEDSNNFIFYAHNVLTGDYNYYVYDLDNETISVFNTEVSDYYKELVEKYKYVVLGALGVIILLLFILIIRRPKKIIINTPPKKELKEIIEEHIDEEIKEEVEKTQEIKVPEVEEEVKEEKKENNNKKNKKNKQNKVKEKKVEEETKELVKTQKIDLDKIEEIDVSEVEEIDKTEQLVQVKEIESISTKDQKKLLKQQKKLLKEEKKRQKARREFDF